MPFLDHVVTDFVYGLDSIVTNSIESLEPDTSFDEPDVIPSSVSSGFFTISITSDNYKLQLPLASNFINCSARLLLP